MKEFKKDDFKYMKEIKPIKYTLSEIDLLAAWHKLPFGGKQRKIKGKKIFFDKKSVILKTVGSKESFTATNNDDKFDLEKGIMMALLKSEGYTYSHIEKLIKEARPKSEIARVVSQWKE